MNPLQEMRDWCQETKLKIRRFFSGESRQTYGPSLTPEAVPHFEIPAPRKSVLIKNHPRADSELMHNHNLPFNAYKVSRTEDGFQSPLKDYQLEACVVARQEAEAVSDDDMIEMKPLLFPRIRDLPSVCFDDDDIPKVGAFFKKKSDTSAEHDGQGSVANGQTSSNGNEKHEAVEERETLETSLDTHEHAEGGGMRGHVTDNQERSENSPMPGNVPDNAEEENCPDKNSSDVLDQAYIRRCSSFKQGERMQVKSPGRGTVEACHSDSENLTGTLPCCGRFPPLRISDGTGHRDAPTDSDAFSLPRTGVWCPNNLSASLGDFKFEFLYQQEKNSFKVRLIQGENIGGFQTAGDINVFVRIYLMPGKLQIQSSEERETKNPLFCEDFVFNKLSLTDLLTRSLRIKVYKSAPDKLSECLGKVNVALGKYDLSVKTRMWRTIEPKVTERDNLGRISIGVSLSIISRKLTVTIGRVLGLRQLQNKKAPNPYVRVEMSQEFGNLVKIRTKTKKKTTNPVFKETLTYDLESVTRDKLEVTNVVVSVMNEERKSLDVMLGQVRLGYESTEESEIQHWQEVKLSPGMDIIRWHQLTESGEVFY